MPRLLTSLQRFLDVLAGPELLAAELPLLFCGSRTARLSTEDYEGETSRVWEKGSTPGQRKGSEDRRGGGALPRA